MISLRSYARVRKMRRRNKIIIPTLVTLMTTKCVKFEFRSV